MDYQIGMKFSTRDQDNDSSSKRNCAAVEKGGWWYRNCSKANLCGKYLDGKSKHFHGVTWNTFHGFFYSLKFAEMKIRPYKQEK